MTTTHHAVTATAGGWPNLPPMNRDSVLHLLVAGKRAAETRSRQFLSTRGADQSVTVVVLPGGARLSIRWRQHAVECGDTLVILTLRELQLFGALLDNPGRTLSSVELAGLAWDRDARSEGFTAAYISSLRKKLAWFGDRFGIRTIRGSGYRFEIPE